MQRRFVVSGKKSWNGSLGLLLAGVLLVGGISSGVAQAPGGAPGGPGRQGGGTPPPPPPPPTAGAHLEFAEGSTASYRVTEQFVGINFPNDAVGTTSGLTGTLGIAADGSVTPGSKLTIDLKGLKSDQDQRDGFVRMRLLETDKFPNAEFVPTKITGVPTMIPFQGQTGVEITGNMTVHGVTKEIKFQGYATFNRDGSIAGRAKTTFNFATFGLTKPTIQRLMSVEDKIDLEIVYRFKRS